MSAYQTKKKERTGIFLSIHSSLYSGSCKFRFELILARESKTL
jgi:hypothetical protein